ncbi:MAG TPA: heavy metal translocating P-type ATPase, partial [bacterium]|nr:heavy metal translocating P-type ATPase [bacterium]
PPLLTGAPFSSWFYRALVLLVVSCPCALVISTPVTILSGLAGAARRGVLIKGGNFLEAIGHVQVIAFDKTGTLTLGRPRVSRVLPLNSHSPAQVLQVAASLGVRSEHHLAGSIVNHAANAGIPLLSAKQVQAIPGMGVQGQVDNGSFFMGNHRFLEEKEQCNPDLEKILHHSEDRGETAVFLGSQDQVMGMITFVDTPRPGARNALDQIKECGLEVVMLTGDNRGAAEAMASQLGIDRVYYELLPENKVQVVQSLTTGGKKVAMVGDGINDAPALAASAVGIAMGGAGTHAALETADIVLMGDDLSQLPLTIRTGRRAVNIIRANIALALLIKAVFLVLTLSGLATLWMALAADMGGSLLVTANGLRLLRTRA